MGKLTLVRGLPGSGKSTYAKAMDAVHLEADMYHVNANGDYVFVPAMARGAHTWCRETAEILLCNGMDVVVSNTFTEMWEMEPYIEFAVDCGFDFKVVRMAGDYGTVHGVPDDVIEKMTGRFVDYDDETIIK